MVVFEAARPAEEHGAAPSPWAAPPARVLACVHSRRVKPGLQALERAGFQVTVASGWADAVARVEELRPVVVLLDADFGDGDGARLCAALRRTQGGAGAPVLALCRRKTDARRMLDAGASDTLDGPVDWEAAARRLGMLERSLRLSHELRRQQELLEEARQHAAQAYTEIQRQSLRDELTGLPNRAQLDQIIERALAGSRRDVRVALLFLDLDRFTEINEAMGRQAGDQVLRVVAQRLSACVHDHRLPSHNATGPLLKAAARLSGDEFTLLVLMPAVEVEPLGRFAQEVLETVSTPCQVKGAEVYVSASVGIAVSNGEPIRSGELVQRAESAMYEAKRHGGAQYAFYSESVAGAVQRRRGLDRMLRAAFEHGELALHYQPVVEADTRRALGVEALLRWYDESLGWVPPSEFVAVAEESGLMVRIGDWVLQQACRQLRAWRDAGLSSLRLAVNVSRCQLQRGNLPARVREVLAETGIPPTLLELEISERGALRDEPMVLAQLRELKRMGVRLLVDDFGTGQSAIAYLKQFPLDGLKIDRSFVDGIAEGGDDAAIASAIVAMAHRLRLSVIAEGVEQPAQLRRLQEFGCEGIQGFLFSEAVPPEQVPSLLTARGVAAVSPSLEEER